MIPILVVLYYNICNFYIQSDYNKWKDNTHYVLYDHIHKQGRFLHCNNHTYIELNIHHCRYTMP